MQQPELTYEVKAEDLAALETSFYRGPVELREVRRDENGNIILLPKE